MSAFARNGAVSNHGRAVRASWFETRSRSLALLTMRIER
jgi:hypothetical protein